MMTRGIGLGVMRRQSPRSLFRVNDGAWLVLNTLTTFQDSAGTTQGAIEQSAGKVVDQSGRGNDLTQATSGVRPKLAGLLNRAIKTEQLDDATWTKGGVTISTNATTAPDGTATADKIVEDSSTGEHRAYQNILLTSGFADAIPIYAKAGERTLLGITAVGLVEPLVVFDLAAGKVSSGVGTMFDAGNGWWRCHLGGVASSSSTNYQLRIVQSGTTTSYTGTAGSGLYVWGAHISRVSYTAVTYKVATEGDSISVTGKWPSLFGLPGGSSVSINAVSGTTTVDMRTRFDTYKSDGSTFFLGLMGINDSRLDVAPATTQANLAYMWSSARALGMTVAVMTTTPWKGDSSGYWTAGRQAASDAMNSWIRSYAVANGYLLVDTYAALEDPARPGYLLPAYDSGDGIHPNAAGQQAIRNAIGAVVFNFAPGAPAYQRVNTVTDYAEAAPTYLRFDGGDDCLSSAAGGAGTTGLFLCMAVKPTGGAGTTRNLWSDRSGSNGYIVRLNTSNKVQFFAGNAGFTSIASTASVDVGGTYLLTVWDDGTSLNVQVDDGSVQSISRTTVAAGTAGFTMGKANDSAAEYFQGNIYTDLIYVKNNGLNAVQRARAKAWVRMKAGL